MSAHSSTTTLTPTKASVSANSTSSPSEAPEPTIFAWDLAPYKSPSGTLSAMVWRCRVWVEATFVFTMLEPWEKAFLMSLFMIVTSLFVVGVYKYLPYHIQFLYSRGMYYLLGRQEQLDWSQLYRAVNTVKTTVGMDKLGL